MAIYSLSRSSQYFLSALLQYVFIDLYINAHLTTSKLIEFDLIKRTFIFFPVDAKFVFTSQNYGTIFRFFFRIGQNNPIANRSFCHNKHGDRMNRLKELRKEKRLTQVQMQMLTGVDQSDYSKIENGKRYYTFEQCKRIAMALGTSMDYLAGLTDEKKPYPRNK